MLFTISVPVSYDCQSLKVSVRSYYDSENEQKEQLTINYKYRRLAVILWCQGVDHDRHMQIL